MRLRLAVPFTNGVNCSIASLNEDIDDNLIILGRMRTNAHGQYRSTAIRAVDIPFSQLETLHELPF
jgi:hypothetical protein